MCNQLASWVLIIVICLSFNNQVVHEALQGKIGVTSKINAIEEMDMRMKVKLLGTNMRGHVIIVLKPFLDFMFFFKPTKAHNMVVLIVNL